MASPPIYRDPRGIALIFAGGIAGSIARGLLTEALGPLTSHIGWGTLVVNLSGAFMLGFIVGFIATLPPVKAERARSWYLVFGTGFMGAYTTYSTLVNESVGQASTRLVSAGAYAALTLVVGLALAGVGMVAGLKVGTRRELRRAKRRPATHSQEDPA